MEAPLWEAFFKGLGGTGFPAILMAIAVLYLHKSCSALIKQLNREREEHIDSLEKHIENCDRDRAELRQKIIELAMRVGHSGGA